MNVKTLRFSVKGDGGHIHVVRAAIAPRTVSLSCSCGGDGVIAVCSHCQALLECDASILAGKNVEDVAVLADAARRTDCARWFDITQTYIRISAGVRAEFGAASSLYCERTGHRFGPEPDEPAEPGLTPEAEPVAAATPVALAEPRLKPARRFYPPPLRAPPIIGRLKTAAAPQVIQAPVLRVRPFRPPTARQLFAARPQPRAIAPALAAAPQNAPVPAAARAAAVPAAPQKAAVPAPPQPAAVEPVAVTPLAQEKPTAPRRVPYAAMARAAITEAKAAWAKGIHHPEGRIHPLLGGTPAEPAAIPTCATAGEFFGPPCPSATSAAPAQHTATPTPQEFGPPMPAAIDASAIAGEPFGPSLEVLLQTIWDAAAPSTPDLALTGGIAPKDAGPSPQIARAAAAASAQPFGPPLALFSPQPASTAPCANAAIAAHEQKLEPFGPPLPTVLMAEATSPTPCARDEVPASAAPQAEEERQPEFLHRANGPAPSHNAEALPAQRQPCEIDPPRTGGDSMPAFLHRSVPGLAFDPKTAPPELHQAR